MATISQAAMVKKFKTLGHKHFCSEPTCRRVYDCIAVMYLQGGCPEPGRNGRCEGHRGSIVPVWSAGRQPQPCCANNVRQITDRDELLSHRLAGPGPWFRCKTCARPSGWPQGKPIS